MGNYIRGISNFLSKLSRTWHFLLVEISKDLLAATSFISNVRNERRQTFFKEIVHRKHFLFISPQNKREVTLEN